MRPPDKLCKLVDAPTHHPLAVSDLHAFEQFLDVDILVVKASGGNKFIKTPPTGSEKQRLYLYLHDVEDKDTGVKLPHFDVIANICGFFGNSKFCEHCLIPYSNLHLCERACYVCKRKKCNFSEVKLSCKLCHMTCRSLSCYKNHLIPQGRRKESPCARWWKCVICTKVVDRKDSMSVANGCVEPVINTSSQIIYVISVQMKTRNRSRNLFSLILNVHKAIAG